MYSFLLAIIEKKNGFVRRNSDFAEFLLFSGRKFLSPVCTRCQGSEI